ncbi:tyrosine--tRNA ligase [Candidatus Nomurabacteria bacterium]|nr:tyrosine--tRNA ligase [Candidatus Nomurabacteria bacterium]
MNSELLTRGVSHTFPSSEALKKELSGGRKLRIYWGVDPTGPTLHLGHVSVLLKLRDWQGEGHQIVVLFGDFTARIGDPTDKKAVRKTLSPEEIENNLKLYREQIGKILDLDKIEFRHNSEWLAKLSFAEVLELASQVTLAQTIKRDMFQKRIAENKDLFLHEFLYPLMQGYDSVALEVDMEIGGNDQIFNMLVGRDLLKKMRGKEKFVVATKLLTDSAGLKMGKTEGNMVSFTDTPSDAYGKIMSWSDDLVAPGLELLTRLTDSQIKHILSGHPKEAKMELAREVVSLIYDESEADRAQENFINTFQRGEEPEEWEEINASYGEKLSEILSRAGAVKSKSDFRRLVEEGAVTEWPNKNLTVVDQIFTAEIKLKVGKRRFLHVVSR